MLKTCKLLTLRCMRRMGVDRALLDSRWRRHRLPIVCFHGVSTADEHECYPGFFLPPSVFRAKLQILRSLDVNALPLGEALRRLHDGTLPPRAIVITIDDGFYGAYAVGGPMLADFGFHATVYLTTHYIHHDRPVFDNMCGYLLKRSYGRELVWPRVLEAPVVLGLQSDLQVRTTIMAYARDRQLDSARKDLLLAELADLLSIDYEDLRRRRLFQIVHPDEIATWQDVDFELHTHRHRVSRNKAVFRDSILRNRMELKQITGRESRHFAYPGGTYLPEHTQWLVELGIQSAVTCESGLATRNSSFMLLPRIMDTARLSIEEMESWVTGLAALLPTRSYGRDDSQLENPAAPSGGSVCVTSGPKP